MSASVESSVPIDSFRVATYNILSSSLCVPSYYAFNDPKDLHAPTRLQRVQDKLDEQITRGAVICLQEVSQDWSGQLHTFFARSGYYFVYSGYGSRKNGYMGSGIAFPLRLYDVESVSVKRISDTRRWPYTPRPTAVQRVAERVKSWANALRDAAATRFPRLKRAARLPSIVETLDDARNRYNQVRHRIT